MYDTTIADRLRDEGLRVIECDGWHTRGSGELYPSGFVFHHTAGGANGSCPSLQGVIYGFAGSAPGPLANVLQSREPDGTDDIFYVVAAGRANHAGTGGWSGLEGNSSVYGLEIEHTGIEHYPHHRRALSVRCAAALLRGIGVGASMACQHFEWSNWGDGSKIDVAEDVDANEWRRLVADAMTGTAPLPEPETEDDMALLVTSDPNSGSDTILYNGFRWRAVVPGEDQQLFDLGIVDTKQARVVDGPTMDRIRRTMPSE